MYSKRKKPILMFSYICILIMSLACSIFSLGNQVGETPSVPTAIPQIPITIPATPDHTLPTSQQWEITPYKVGDRIVDNPEPGWTYKVIYFGIKNLSNQLDYYSLNGDVPGWLSDNISDDLPLSQPSIGASFIKTNEGYQYQKDPTITSFFGNLMPIIQGDDDFFFINLPTEITDKFGISYAPQFDLLPPIPPGFRLFGSISFRIAENTTGWTLVIPGSGEYPIDNINSTLQFPFDQHPNYVKLIGDSFSIDNGVTATPTNFIRNPDGSASIDLVFHNPTGYDFTASDFQVHLINDRGWLVGQPNYFKCSLFGCPNIPTIGPGQSATYTLGWVIPPEIDTLYMELIYHEGLSSNGTFLTQGWSLYELKNNNHDVRH